MDKPLVTHAHHHCHVLIKASGADTCFNVRGKLAPLTDNSAVLVNAWEAHSYEHQGPLAPRTVILALYIEPEWLGEIQRHLSVAAHPQFFTKPCVEISARIRKLADDLAMEMLCADDIPAARLETVLFDLMIAVIDPFSEWRNMYNLAGTRNLATSDPRIRKAMHYMRQNVGAELDMDRIATHSGLSRAHFFTLFRRCTNLTPNVYSNVLRMEAAIVGLTESRDSLTDISLRLGFSASSHFTRFFRQHIGSAPLEFRKVVQRYEKQTLG
jgi:AraC-like DNA-binding protein